VLMWPLLKRSNNLTRARRARADATRKQRVENVPNLFHGKETGGEWRGRFTAEHAQSLRTHQKRGGWGEAGFESLEMRNLTEPFEWRGRWANK